MRRLLPTAFVGLLVFVSSLVVPIASSARAKAPLTAGRCPTPEGDEKDFRKYCGLVKSADGTVSLDTDVTLPKKGDGPFPLIVMLHGLGGSKTSSESTSVEGEGGDYHFNNLWFASHGYAVLTYTARGFHADECLKDGPQSVDGNPDLYPDSPACRPQVDHVKYEVADTQYLVGSLVDGDLISASDVAFKNKKVGITGISYGGGHAWLLTRSNKWTSPEGTTVKVAAVVPIIGWTDIMNALAPNGRVHAGDVPTTDVDERAVERVGVAKESYINGYSLLLKTSSADGVLPGYINEWLDRILDDGEPYNDAVTQDLVDKLLSGRSAYYVKKKKPDPAILAVQGFTDEIFPVMEPLRMYNRLLQENPDYPINLYFGDWGHPIAQSKADESAYIADLVNDWFDHYVAGEGPAPDRTVEARTTDCDSDQMGVLYRASDWAGLQADAAEFDLSLAGSLTSPTNDQLGSYLNPVKTQDANECRTTTVTGVATTNLAAEVVLPTGLDMLGLPQVQLDADPSAVDMFIAARLWDVDPLTNEQTLVDRGVYRLGDDVLQPDVIFQLFGNAYSFAPGHSLKLELTADDSPTFRTSNSTGTIAISNVTLSIPQANPAALVP